jgi:predicted nucleic acid-binding protein
MNGADAFFDTSVVLYLLSGDAGKADRAEELLEAGGIVSVQVLDEFAAAAKRKLGLSWSDVREVLSTVRELCTTRPVTEEIHDRGLEVAERYGFSLYDSMIVAAAQSAGCKTLYTEDLRDRQIIDGALTIRNPFRSGAS